LLQLGRVDAGRRGDDVGPGRLLIDGVPELRSAVVGVGNVPRQVGPEPGLDRYASGRDAPALHRPASCAGMLGDGAGALLRVVDAYEAASRPLDQPHAPGSRRGSRAAPGGDQSL
jgi:hypothetical protein